VQIEAAVLHENRFGALSLLEATLSRMRVVGAENTGVSTGLLNISAFADE